MLLATTRTFRSLSFNVSTSVGSSSFALSGSMRPPSRTVASTPSKPIAASCPANSSALNNSSGFSKKAEEQGKHIGGWETTLTVAQQLGEYALGKGRAGALYKAAINEWDQSGRKESAESIVKERLKDAIEAPLKAKIKELETQIATGQAASRSGKGPSTATSTSGTNANKNDARRAYASGEMSTAEAERLGII